MSEDLNVENLYERLSGLFEDFKTNHEKFDQKGTKAAGARARKSLGEIKKLITPYRKASLEQIKG